jgi:AcrR family transcriptional regulator
VSIGSPESKLAFQVNPCLPDGVVTRKTLDAPSSARPRDRVLAVGRRQAISGGYEGVVMRDVARQANVSTRTLYRYFSSRDHVLVAIYAETIGELDAAWSLDPQLGGLDGIVAFTNAMFARVDESPRLWQAMVLACGSADPDVLRARDATDAIVRRIYRDELAKVVDDADRIVDHLNLAFFGVLMSWAQGRLPTELVGPAIREHASLLIAGATADRPAT